MLERKRSRILSAARLHQQRSSRKEKKKSAAIPWLRSFAESKEPTLESESSSYEPSIHEELERELSEILKRLSSLESAAESSKEAEVFDWKIDKSGIPEIYSVASFGDDVDESTEICGEEIDVFMNFLRCTDYYLQAEANEENCPCLLSENYEEWSSECFVVNEQESKDEELAKSTQNQEFKYPSARAVSTVPYLANKIPT